MNRILGIRMSLFLAFSGLPSSLVNRRKYIFNLSPPHASISITVYKDIKQQKMQEQDMAGPLQPGTAPPSAIMSYIYSVKASFVSPIGWHGCRLHPERSLVNRKFQFLLLSVYCPGVGVAYVHTIENGEFM